jgi:hypothetical protein
MKEFDATHNQKRKKTAKLQAPKHIKLKFDPYSITFEKPCCKPKATFLCEMAITLL